MKFTTVSLVCLSFGVMYATAAPAKNNNIPRQNDMPKCQDGKNGPSIFSTYRNAHCDNDCTYEESSGDNKGGVCTGECVQNIPPAMPGGGQMLPNWYCSSKWSE